MRWASLTLVAASIFAGPALTGCSGDAADAEEAADQGALTTTARTEGMRAGAYQLKIVEHDGRFNFELAAGADEPILSGSGPAKPGYETRAEAVAALQATIRNIALAYSEARAGVMTMGYAGSTLQFGLGVRAPNSDAFVATSPRYVTDKLRDAAIVDVRRLVAALYPVDANALKAPDGSTIALAERVPVLIAGEVAGHGHRAQVADADGTIIARTLKDRFYPRAELARVLADIEAVATQKLSDDGVPDHVTITDVGSGWQFYLTGSDGFPVADGGKEFATEAEARKAAARLVVVMRSLATPQPAAQR